MARRSVLVHSTLAFIFLLAPAAFAQEATLRGTVTDAETGEPLTGATIVFPGTPYYDVAGLDGSFQIRGVPYGEYRVEVSFVSYRPVDELLVVNAASITRTFRLQSEEFQLDGVDVTAQRDLTSEEGARATERLAPRVVNVMPARAIELSPDITVANVVQRVSGVSLERSSSGDGQHAIVRGMDKRYNTTLVNGIKIPSPDVRHRYVPLDIFPSDLLDRLEVTKALTPDMEGDAIGGVIDMRMKAAPPRRTVRFNVGTGVSGVGRDRAFARFDGSAVSTRSPRTGNGNGYRATEDDFPYHNIALQEGEVPLARVLGFSAGDRFFGQRLGALLAGSYTRTFRGSDGLFFDMDVDREANNPFYDTVQQRTFSVDQERAGLHAKLDYVLSARHRFDLYVAFIQLRDAETRARVDTNLRIGRAQGPGTGRISERFRSRQQRQRVANLTLQGTHELPLALRAEWSAAASRATSDDPDMAEVHLLTGASRVADGTVQREPVLLGRDLVRRWTNNTDQDLAGYLDLHHERRLLGYASTLSIGGMARHKNRQNIFDSYLLRAAPSRQEWTGDVFDHSWRLFNPGGTPTDPLNYDSSEDVVAAYAQARLAIGRLQVVGGARVEHTRFDWETSAPATVEGRVGEIAYTDWLPSLHFRFTPARETNYRLSYFRSISRPSFFEVIPYQIIEEDFWERGNPELRRTRAHNVDARFEHYPTLQDQFMLGVFYKRIVDPIESALAIDGQRIFLQPNNFGTATNTGLELDVTRYFRRFGVRGYYTYTDSRITTSKIFRFRGGDGGLTSRQEQQTRSLQGQSRHIGNFALLYKDARRGTDAQVAASYTGRRIIGVSPYFENDVWQRALTQLDFSFEQRVFGQARLYVKVNNLLDAPLRADILRPNTANPHQVPYEDVSETVKVREDFYGRTFLTGMKVQL